MNGTDDDTTNGNGDSGDTSGSDGEVDSSKIKPPQLRRAAAVGGAIGGVIGGLIGGILGAGMG